MQYVGGATKESGCVFCNRLAAEDDVRSLILHRGRRAFLIMNLFPYNTGHVMLVPNEHVASPEDADLAALSEMAELLPATLRAARRALTCHGFNVGLNVGSVAGAGIAEHMHQHIVPRWNGDANFMPIIGSTMVIPELIPVTYAKLRAELSRPTSGTVSLAILDDADTRVVIADTGELPAIEATVEGSLAAEALRFTSSLGLQPTLAGWAGSPRADADQMSGLALFATGAPIAGYRWSPLDGIDASLSERDKQIVAYALGNAARLVQS
jgi:ATP adenylyltransferase